MAAPFLSSLSGRGLKAQSAPTPKRLIVMFTHYGCVTTRWFPVKSHGALTADDLQPTTLKYLVPYLDKVLMPRGIRAMNEWTQDMTLGQGNDNYTQVCGSYFTCQPISPNSDNPFSFDQSTRVNAKPVGPSLDNVMAQQLSAGGTPLFMRLANQSPDGQSSVSYSSSMTLFPGLGLPTQIFSGLTGLFQGDTLSPDTYQAVRGQSLIDLVRDDLSTLERYDMSQADKNKLEAWKALLHDTTPMVVSAACNPDTATSLGITSDDVDFVTAAPLGQDVLTSTVTGSLDGSDIYSNLAVLAAVCNSNPVIFLKYPGAYLYTGLGLSTDSANIAGRVNSADLSGPCYADAIDMVLKIDDYYAQKFAQLVSQLNGIEEDDGTLLDNTATVWFQEVSDGLARNLNNLPIVQVGSCGGYFKTGWAVNVEDGSATLSQGNSEAYCTNDGNQMIPAYSKVSGTDPKYGNAPINKYFCNLMNALGVRAGDDGFPAVGGNADVSRFGMYDRTEDFVGGGSVPPNIHDPGEFAALKANS
ncbi:MAG TPA: DUF1552 domain-containing protein [Polyangiaceae bacterium]|nr:DUF1552 domain-containing protein [Polyangiaceae bacterium]